jgi:pyruvate dehydrogenase (quinone)/pyruvate oxidase
MGKAHVENSVDLAIRAALSYKGVAHITIPADIQDMQADERSKRNKPSHTSNAPARSGAIPDEFGMRRALVCWGRDRRRKRSNIVTRC